MYGAWNFTYTSAFQLPQAVFSDSMRPKMLVYLETKCVSSGENATLRTQDPCPLSVPARLACCLQNNISQFVRANKMFLYFPFILYISMFVICIICNILTLMHLLFPLFCVYLSFFSFNFIWLRIMNIFGIKKKNFSGWININILSYLKNKNWCQK